MKYEVPTPTELGDILILLRCTKKKFFFVHFRRRETAFFKGVVYVADKRRVIDIDYPPAKISELRKS